MTALSTLNLMPTKKEEIKSFSQKIKTDILNGNVDPLQILSNLKAVEKTIKIITDSTEVKAAFLNSMHGDKTHEAYGCLFEEAEVGVKYDYSVCNQWNEVETKIAELKEIQKSVESRLKSASLKSPYLDPTTGEEITGIAKSSTTIVKVTLK